MTCIVGIVDGNKVILGADRQGTDGRFGKVNRVDKKVFNKGEFVIGFTTSYRMGQLIQYKFNPPALTENQDLMDYMVSDFVEGIRRTLKDGGFTRVDQNEEIGGTFLVGFRGRLFQIESDFQVGEAFDKFDAVGCGDTYALGAMMTSIKYGETNQQKILINGLEAAHYFSAGVGGEFDFVATGDTYSKGEPNASNNA